MLLGPIFRAELLRTARRRRYYLARFLYGLVLFFIIWIDYAAASAVSEYMTIQLVADFARVAFIRFSVVQLITILALIPALFGGAIADEKQRKTLHYLMASRLSSFEIVIDKLLGRTPHLLIFLALGLPVICLLSLVGGVAPDYLFVAYVGTISTASMAVAITILVSTLARKVRQAVLVSYVLLLAWLFVPSILVLASPILPPTIYAWITPVNDWVGATSPLSVYLPALRGPMGGLGLTASMVDRFFWMVGLQLGTAVVLIAVAVWRLRPAFRRHEATQPRRKWFESRTPKAQPARASRFWDRPGCGDDAMAWKERYFARNDLFTKMVVLPALIFVSVFLALYVGIDESILHAFQDSWRGGLRGWGNDHGMVAHIRIVSAWYVAIWLLAVAGATASSVAVEREEDTWVSLTSSPLTGWEILRGKVVGAIWAQRGFGLIPLGLWTFGLVFGAIHPVGFLFTVVAFVLVTWMVAALGIHSSLRSTTTSKAITATIGRLAILYGYPIFLVTDTFRELMFRNNYAYFIGLPPRLVVAPLCSYTEFPGLRFGALFTPWPALYLMGIYVAIAATLTYQSLSRFDRWLDRPTLTIDGPANTLPAKVVEPAEPVLQS